MSARATLYAALKAWCEDPSILVLCPQLNDPTKSINRLWEELHYHQPSELDQLVEKLGAPEKISANKEAALRRVRPWLEKIFGSSGKVADPEFIVRDRQRHQQKADRKGRLSALNELDEPSTENQPTTEEEDTMKVAIKEPKDAKKAAPSKPDVKALKKANKVATKSLTEMRGRPGAYSDEQKITMLVKENPRREGSDVYDQFEMLKKSKTVGAYKKAGGRTATLAKCVKNDWAKVS